MSRKAQRRVQLLRDYEATGDEEYRRAAEVLRVSLFEHLEYLAQHPGRRRQGAGGKGAEPRLYRVHRAVTAGASVLAAARQEVTEHGRGQHASDEAAVEYLRAQYREEASGIAASVAAAGQTRQRWASIEHLHRSTADQMQQHWILIERGCRSIVDRMLQQRTWVEQLRRWRNTLPRVKPNDTDRHT